MMTTKVYPERKKNEFYGPLLLLFQISRLFGVAPLTFSEGLKVSRSYYIYSLLLTIILNAVILTGFSLDITEPEISLRAREISSRVIWISNLTIIISVTCVGCFGAPARLECIISILDLIDKVRLHIGSDKKKDTTENLQYALIFFFTFAISALVSIDFYHKVIEALTYDMNVKVLPIYSMFYIEFVIQVLLELQFSLTALILRNVLKDCNDVLQIVLDQIKNLEGNTDYKVKNNFLSVNQINSAIDTLYKNFENIDKDKKFVEEACEKVRTVSTMYEAICEMKQQINKGNALLLSLLLISFFLYLIITPYYIVIHLRSPNTEASIIFLQVAWLVFHGLNLLLIIEPCHYTEIEMERSRILVSQLLRRACSCSWDLYFELNIFYKILLLKSSYSYSPFSMCVLGRPLIATMLGAVVTYLVIIFQFQSNIKGA